MTMNWYCDTTVMAVLVEAMPFRADKSYTAQPVGVGSTRTHSGIWQAGGVSTSDERRSPTIASKHTVKVRANRVAVRGVGRQELHVGVDAVQHRHGRLGGRNASGVGDVVLAKEAARRVYCGEAERKW